MSKVLERKFPGRRLVFIFDHSPIHRTKADDALNASEMNVGPEGAQPLMRDGFWHDKRGRLHRQPMVDAKGRAKGLRQVLIERGLFKEGMVKADMVALLSKQPDFSQQPTLVEELLSKRGHSVVFLPKFHCELNPVERIWATAKRYTRDRCTFKLKNLRKLIPKALTITLPEIQSYFAHCQAWAAAYAKGMKYSEAKACVKAGRKQRQLDRAQRAKANASDSVNSSSSSGSDSDSGHSDRDSDSDSGESGSDSDGNGSDTEQPSDRDRDSDSSEEEDSNEEMSEEEESNHDAQVSRASRANATRKRQRNAGIAGPDDEEKRAAAAKRSPPRKRRHVPSAAESGSPAVADEVDDCVVVVLADLQSGSDRFAESRRPPRQHHSVLCHRRHTSAFVN